MLPKPPEWAEINDYLRGLRARIRNEFREKTYLPLAGKTLPSISPVVQEACKDPFVFPIHQVIRQIMGRSYGGDSASAQIAAASRQSRIVRNILRHLDHAEAPLILLGEPGSGKTMTLQQAAMLLADRERRRIFPQIPIYVRLGEFYVKGKVNKDNVLEYVKKSVPSSLQLRINELERNGRLVIFFDGMDEMSRERYGEHTEALSVFADWTASKTLFSCRITDFSPRFLHQRLVILPFDRDQVAEYLKKYVEQFPVVIDGKPWSLKELTKHIAQGELPIEANNPFVLWLLCLYLQDKKSWPGSRVEMLSYYNERNYQRKNEETPADEPRFPEMDRAFREWARFAYLITERNRGAAMPVSLLQDGQDAAMVQEMVRFGKRCGVLAESHEKYGEYLVRFQHHRFQEFFTALHIHDNRLPINWLDRLDAPRWQETMLNLILMGEAGDVVHTFANSVIALMKTCQSEILEIQHLTKPEFVLTDEHETLLADRLEVVSRIMRQIGSGAPDVTEAFMPPFREAVSVLADFGNPITQVKMLRACQNVPEIDFIEALRNPLNSSVNWVRNQALLLIASNQASARAIGTDLASEIGYDLGNGLFPKHFSAYWKAAFRSRHIGHWWSVLAGSCSYLVYLLLLFAVAAMLYFGMWSLRSVYIETSQVQSSLVQYYQKLSDWTYFDDDKWKLPEGWVSELFKQKAPQPIDFRIFHLSILSEPLAIAIFIVVLLAAAGITIKVNPPLIWKVIPGSAVGIAALMPAIAGLWTGSGNGFFILLVSVMPLAITTFIVTFLIATPIHFVVLAIYLAATATLRQRDHALTTFFVGAWLNCGYKEGFNIVGSILGIVAYPLPFAVVFMVVIVFLVKPILQVISDLSHLPFYPLINVIIIMATTTLIGTLMYAGMKNNLAPILKVFRILSPAIGWVLMVGFGIGVGWLLSILLSTLSKWGIPSWVPWISILRTVAVIIWLIIIFVFISLTKTLWRSFMYFAFPAREKFPLARSLMTVGRRASKKQMLIDKKIYYSELTTNRYL